MNFSLDLLHDSQYIQPCVYRRNHRIVLQALGGRIDLINYPQLVQHLSKEKQSNGMECIYSLQVSNTIDVIFTTTVVGLRPAQKCISNLGGRHHCKVYIMSIKKCQLLYFSL